MGVLVGIPLGVLAAVTPQQGCPTPASRLFSLVGYAMPDFYLGALLLIVFCAQPRMVPDQWRRRRLLDRLYHVFLPALTLAFVKSAFVSRLTRTSLLEVLGQGLCPHGARQGRAREPRHLSPRAAQRAAAGRRPGLGLSLLATLSGSVAIELVFNRPGIGSMLISAIASATIR